MTSFARSLEFGRVAESDIARWINARGGSVLPVYEKEIHEGKGPQFYSSVGEHVAPDMFVFPALEWIEAKHKTVFSWHRLSQRWVTGIDLHHYEAYKRVQDLSRRRVWLLFLHRSNIPDPRDVGDNKAGKGCPPKCPTGLYGGSLGYLSRHVNHRHSNHGRHGMVYWAETTLTKLAALTEIKGNAA